MNAAQIESALKPLVGLEWRSIGRAADLLWLHFGEMRKVPAWGGGTKTVGQWAIHVQCPWRLQLFGGECLTASDLNIDSERNPIVDKPDQLAQSRFDEVAAYLRDKFEMVAPKIVSIQNAKHNGFTMGFSDGGRFEVAPDGNGEAWRLFNPSTDNPHFIVCD
jgi:hypothetical protein